MNCISFSLCVSFRPFLSFILLVYLSGLNNNRKYICSCISMHWNGYSCVDGEFEMSWMMFACVIFQQYSWLFSKKKKCWWTEPQRVCWKCSKYLMCVCVSLEWLYAVMYVTNWSRKVILFYGYEKYFCNFFFILEDRCKVNTRLFLMETILADGVSFS